jgi:hypothetical protein
MKIILSRHRLQSLNLNIFKMVFILLLSLSAASATNKLFLRTHRATKFILLSHSIARRLMASLGERQN